MRHLLHQLPLLFILSILYSCNNQTQRNTGTFLSLEETLTASNRTISRATYAMLHELEKKVYEPASHEKAILFYPKAKLIQQMTNNTAEYIEVIKRLLKKQAGIDSSHAANNEAWNNTPVVNDLFGRQGTGKELYKTLQQYRSGTLGADEDLSKEFSNDPVLTTIASDQRSSGDFTTEFFHDIPVAAALCMLTRFQSNIYLAGNKVITYLNYRITDHTEFYTPAYYPLISLSSACVLPGQYIEVTAGVGALNPTCKPTCIISGRSIPFDGTGVAISKFRVSQQPGNYSKLVELSYYDQDGYRKTVQKAVYYTVFNKDSTAR